MTVWTWTPELLAQLRGRLADVGTHVGELTATPIGDGHSNLTFLITDGEQRLIVRRPPPPPSPVGANDMLREARVLTALADTAVPVPTVVAVFPAGDLLDVDTYVMEAVDGDVITGSTPESMSSPEQRGLVSASLVDILADLHAVNWRATGLGDFGRPNGFNRRHLDRVSSLVRVDGEMLDDFAGIYQWLQARVPYESRAAIVHNDYRLGNVIIDPTTSKVAAVLDWELATIGDPLFDLGYLLTSTPSPDGPMTPTQAMGAAQREPGYLTRSELISRYVDRTGADLSSLEWFEVLSSWKVAALYEYSRRRHQSGQGDPYFADPAHVESFLSAAEQRIGTSWLTPSRSNHDY